MPQRLHLIKPIAIDTHVHVYPSHDPSASLLAAFANLDRAAGEQEGPRALLLAERADCAYFEELASGRGRLPEGWIVEPTQEAHSVRLRSPNGRGLYVVAGRQVATRERLEILALGSIERFADGLPAEETLASVRESGALPVLCWSPGKWLFSRGRIVERLIRDAASSTRPLCVADSALRPLGWGKPRLLRLAMRLGIMCIAGSDPLPLTGEEHRTGSFGIASNVPVDEMRPFRTIRDIATSGAFEIVGGRLSPWALGQRLLAMRGIRSVARMRD